jgi:hypothetical protein
MSRRYRSLSVSKMPPECLTKKNDRVATLKSESALGVLAHFAMAGVFPGILKTEPRRSLADA